MRHIGDEKLGPDRRPDFWRDYICGPDIGARWWNNAPRLSRIVVHVAGQAVSSQSGPFYEGLLRDVHKGYALTDLGHSVVRRSR